MATQQMGVPSLSGFPSTKKQQDPNDPVTSAGVGMPPPPVPPTPDVPKVPLTAANRYGLDAPSAPNAPSSQPGGYQTTAPWGSVDINAAPPAGAPGTLDLMPQRYDLTVPPKNSAPPSTGQTVTPPPDATGSAKPPVAYAVAPPATTPPPTQPPATPAGGINFSDWMKAHAGTDAAATPAAQAPTTTPPPEKQDPNNHNALDPNSPDYDPILAKQIADQNAGPQKNPNPPVTDTHLGDQTSGGGGQGSGSQGSGGQQPAAPSTNPADYKPTVTPQGDANSDWNAIFKQWLTTQMGNSSPYSNDLIQKGQQVLTDSINRQTDAGQRQLEEFYASRGLTGSSVEAQSMGNFMAQMQEQYRQGVFDLGQSQVNAYLQQEQTVGNLGSQFGQNLTDQQRLALTDIQNQISNNLQKYGIDKQSADAAAGREVQKQISQANITSQEKMHAQDLIAQYGGNVTPDAWDAFAAQYGQAEAAKYFGPRPTGTSTTTSTSTTPTDPNTPKEQQQYPNGTKPSTAPTDNPAMNSDVYNYQGINASIPDTLTMRQQRYDAFVQRWGQDNATKNLGSRPTSAQATNSAGMTPQQTNNWAGLQASAGHDFSASERQQVWDDYASRNGAQDATDKLGPRPTA